MSDESISVDLETLLVVTRQKLITATVVNTELEAIIADLRAKLQKLEEEKKSN